MAENDELGKFLRVVGERHGRVDPCFMTGKGCVYTDQIDQALKSRVHKGEAKGFMIMPFRPRLRVFFENCLRPFFYANYDQIDEPKGGMHPAPKKIALERADDVARPGIIVCEGICKRIQESDFVVADISVPNDNVFYELGLAYGIGHKIVLIHQKGAQFGADRAEYFRKGEGEHSVKQYENLQRIDRDRFTVTDYFWRRESSTSGEASKKPEPEVLFLEIMADGKKEQAPGLTTVDDDDIRLSFSEHILSDIGLALSRIAESLQRQEEAQQAVIPPEYLHNIIEAHLDKASIVDPADEFKSTRDRVDRSYCLVVRTGIDCHPMAYFWLGYGHARGKNVIPITKLVMDEPEAVTVPRGGSLEPRSQPRGKVLDLAFDIRAQRHMTFDPQRPELLEHQLEQTLAEMIRADFSEWSRRKFWAALLGSSGEVSIITGGLHSEDHNREMVGDWDLRAASELTSYFSRHQYRPKIETPIYQPEFAKHFDPTMTTGRYIDQVTREIRIADKNCVVIASPDVNPLTEILLGRLFGVDDKLLFSDKLKTADCPNAAFIVYKERKKAADGGEAAGAGGLRGTAVASRAFFKEEIGQDGTEQRGFVSHAFERGDKKLLPYYGQNEYEQRGRDPFKIYAQLIVARNPFSPQDDPARYVVILNGVSGPATFALTQVVTGGGNEEFESRKQYAFDPAGQSESILNKLLPYISSPNFHCIHTLIEVEVSDESKSLEGEATPSEGLSQRVQGAGATFDWRGIVSWRLAEEMLSGGGVREVPRP